MAKRVIEDATLQRIAEAIREKAKTTEGMTPLQMPQAILDIIGAEIEERDNPSGGKTVYINSEVPEEAGLPEGFTRLKWIQSDGPQYADTGVYPNQDTRIVFDITNIETSDWAMLFGARHSHGSNAFALFAGPNADGYEWHYGSQAGEVYGHINAGRHLIDMNSSEVSIDGVSIATFSPQSFNCSYPMFLLATNESGSPMSKDVWPTVAQVHSGKIYDGGTIVRNYIPCLNASGEAGLWDTVTQEFYGDTAGVGFIAGPVVLDYTLPEGFEELEWIKSDGRQHLDTGVVPNTETKVELDFMWDYIDPAESTWTSAIGVRDTSTGAMQQMHLTAETAQSYAGFSSQEISPSPSFYDPNTRYQIELDKNGVRVNGVLGGTFTAATMSTTLTMYLFRRNDDGSPGNKFYGRVYGCRIYQNSTLVRYYVPCRTNTGEVGLWDVVHEVFYGDDAGIGFITGPVVGNSVSKVVLEDEVLIDLTGDTISPETVLAGFIGHDKTGAQFVGELVQKAGGNPIAYGYLTTNNATSFTISGLPFRPVGIVFACSLNEGESFVTTVAGGHYVVGDPHLAYIYADMYGASFQKTGVTITDTSIAVPFGYSLKRKIFYVVWGDA